MIDIESGEIQTIAGDGEEEVLDGEGLSARFHNIESLTTDGTTVWVADLRCLRAVETVAPYTVTTIAGDIIRPGCDDGFSDVASFNQIRGLTYLNGCIWFVDGDCSTLRRFNSPTGEVVTVAGSPWEEGVERFGVDGVGLDAKFEDPMYMAVGASDILYISETNGATIRAFDTRTNEVTTIAGNGMPMYFDAIGTDARIARPRGLTFDGTSLYFVEYNQHTVRQIVLSTLSVTTMIGSHGEAGYLEEVGLDARLFNPIDIVYHPDTGALYFVDAGNYVIRRIQ